MVSSALPVTCGRDSGVCALANVAMVTGGMLCSKFVRPSVELLVLTGVIEAFWRMVILCFGVPQFGITAVLV